MRIMIKGGVWKNTEDEILKAAVMKYGKNQWARISSLLVRKSAKQCKARWYEWLDPSIKKTEWTREEDEKLLHLAKLMPTQWRTIAPIVGRTPSQCLERYEKLLDAACVKDENYEPSDDPRKLRPGEIDPNPESKPARPDPVDMDEDEKEMLSEARARLANTRGKKAKRKAREKQLEEARRLASLQKRRELKAAGIDNRHRRRKRKGIDYNAEIPFEKKPPPGFFDATDEERPVEQPKFPTTIEELEGKRRVDIEVQLRKQDIAKNKIAQRQDAPSAILQVNKLNDPETVRKRSRLMLPPPQISDHELEEIAKMGYSTDLVLANEELAEGSSATRALVANYSQTPQHGMTPLRTPQRTPGGKVDAIMMEAENLARLRESQTPLLGGENPELHPSDFSGVTPKKREFLTPNPIATPLLTPGGMGLTPRVGMTPSKDGYSFGVTPKGTPIRDELHINEDMDMLDSAKLEQRRQAELKRNLRSGLINLPQPKNEYQIVMPPVPEENEELDEEKMEEDMSDKLAREKAKEEARLEALLRKRSKVLQRELPRPPAASLDLIKKSLKRGDEDKSSFMPITLFEQADEMIRRELLMLLGHDNAKYPIDEKADKEKKKGTRGASNGRLAVSIPEIEDFEEHELKEANSLIEEEVSFLRLAMGHEDASFDDFVEARDACQDDLMYFPGRNSYGLASIASNSEKLEAFQNEFENVKNRMEAETRKAVKLEQKIKVLTHGHQMRSTKLWSQIEATFKQIDTAGTEFECFQTLQKQEQLAASYRIKGLLEEVNKQRELEQILQRRYGNLIAEQDRVHRLLEEYKLQAQIQEEIEAKNRALEVSVSAKDLESNTIISENTNTVASSDEKCDSIMTDASLDETPVGQEIETTQIADVTQEDLEVEQEKLAISMVNSEEDKITPTNFDSIMINASLDETPVGQEMETTQIADVTQKDLEVEQEKLATSMVISEEDKRTPTNFDSYITPEIPREEQVLVNGSENPVGISAEEGGLPLQSSDGISDGEVIHAKINEGEEIVVNLGEQIQVAADAGSGDKAGEKEFPTPVSSESYTELQFPDKDQNPVRSENPVDILTDQGDFSLGSNGDTSDKLIVPNSTTGDIIMVGDKTTQENGNSYAGLKFPINDQCLITQSENPIDISVMETDLTHGIDGTNIPHLTNEQEKMIIDPIEKIDTMSSSEVSCMDAKGEDSMNETTDS